MNNPYPLDPNTIAVLAFEGISLFHLSVPCLVFGEDRTEVGVPRFNLKVCASESGPLRSTVGVTVAAPFDLDGLHEAGTVIVYFASDRFELNHPPMPLSRSSV